MKTELYNNDCMLQLDLIEGDIIDVICISPPYNFNKKYSTYNDKVNPRDYHDWLSRLFYKLMQVLKTDGSFFLNFGYKPSDPMMPFWVANRAIACRFEIQNVIHWVKSISIGDESYGHIQPINSERYLSSAHEYVFHFTKTGNSLIDRLAVGVPYQDKTNIDRWKNGQDRRCRGNVWFIPYKTIQKRTDHPTPFPVELPEMCIKLHGLREDMVVMDPLMGIGTTGVAARRLGVDRFIGIEMDKGYFEIAQRRIEEEV